MSTTTAPTWADSTQTTDPAESSHVYRSPIVSAMFGTGVLRAVIVDDGAGPRLHVEVTTEDGLDADQAAALVDALATEAQRLRDATAR